MCVRTSGAATGSFETRVSQTAQESGAMMGMGIWRTSERSESPGVWGVCCRPSITNVFAGKSTSNRPFAGRRTEILKKDFGWRSQLSSMAAFGNANRNLSKGLGSTKNPDNWPKEQTKKAGWTWRFRTFDAHARPTDQRPPNQDRLGSIFPRFEF